MPPQLFLKNLQKDLDRFHEATQRIVLASARVPDTSSALGCLAHVVDECNLFYRDFQRAVARVDTIGQMQDVPEENTTSSVLDPNLVISGAAEWAREARLAAFEERCAGGLVNTVVGGFDQAKLKEYTFPPALFEQLNHVSPGTHGWMFSTNQNVEDALSKKQPFRLVHHSERDGKIMYGTYIALRWYEGDMVGPEFVKLSGKVQRLIIRHLSGARPGSAAFRDTMRAVRTSKRSIPCLFLRCVDRKSMGEDCGRSTATESEGLWPSNMEWPERPQPSSPQDSVEVHAFAARAAHVHAQNQAPAVSPQQAWTRGPPDSAAAPAFAARDAHAENQLPAVSPQLASAQVWTWRDASVPGMYDPTLRRRANTFAATWGFNPSAHPISMPTQALDNYDIPRRQSFPAIHLTPATPRADGPPAPTPINPYPPGQFQPTYLHPHLYHNREPSLAGACNHPPPGIGHSRVLNPARHTAQQAFHHTVHNHPNPPQFQHQYQYQGHSADFRFQDQNTNPHRSHAQASLSGTGLAGGARRYTVYSKYPS
ncbi:hypothetical protein B0H10DRAFT_2022718 [Mycena sp. CBHHK59/15]|nr:hypothetical protein B0H10DRAFT_2022718 [Mycena sp. CBHHK59/15]